MTMTRTYVAKRLLEHGPLTAQEFLEITGWDQREATRTLQRLLETGLAIYKYKWTPKRKRNCRNKIRHYALASSVTASGSETGMPTTPRQPTNGTEVNFHGSDSQRQSVTNCTAEAAC